MPGSSAGAALKSPPKWRQIQILLALRAASPVPSTTTDASSRPPELLSKRLASMLRRPED